MNKHLLTITVAIVAAFCTMAIFSFKSPAPEPAPAVVYQYKQITTIESVVPGGLGRSRILSTDDKGQTIEKDLKNFYSMVGINFGNIANNDDVIVGFLNGLSEQGWELVQVTTGSNQQNDNMSGGLFITRYIFKRAK